MMMRKFCIAIIMRISLQSITHTRPFVITFKFTEFILIVFRVPIYIYITVLWSIINTTYLYTHYKCGRLILYDNFLGSTMSNCWMLHNNPLCINTRLRGDRIQRTTACDSLKINSVWLDPLFSRSCVLGREREREHAWKSVLHFYDDDRGEIPRHLRVTLIIIFLLTIFVLLP